MIILAQTEERELFTCEELEVRYNELVEEYNTLNFGGNILLLWLVGTYIFMIIGFVVWLVNRRDRR